MNYRAISENINTNMKCGFSIIWNFTRNKSQEVQPYTLLTKLNIIDTKDGHERSDDKYGFEQNKV